MSIDETIWEEKLDIASLVESSWARSIGPLRACGRTVARAAARIGPRAAARRGPIDRAQARAAAMCQSVLAGFIRQ